MACHGLVNRFSALAPKGVDTHGQSPWNSVLRVYLEWHLPTSARLAFHRTKRSRAGIDPSGLTLILAGIILLQDCWGDKDGLRYCRSM